MCVCVCVWSCEPERIFGINILCVHSPFPGLEAVSLTFCTSVGANIKDVSANWYVPLARSVFVHAAGSGNKASGSLKPQWHSVTRCSIAERLITGSNISSFYGSVTINITHNTGCTLTQVHTKRNQFTITS